MSWRSECVGRMQIKLPGEADIAIVPTTAFAEQFGSVVLSPNPESRFADGQAAGWTKFSYFGRLLITHPLDDQVWSTISQSASQAKQRALSSSAKTSNGGQATNSMQIGPLDGVGWESASHMRLVVRAGSSAIRWSVDFRPDSAAEAQSTQRALLTGLRPRAMFETPAAEGVCLPYVFIQDDGKRSRSIAATYRLKDHPDVTIWLEDSSAQSMVTSTGNGNVIGQRTPTASLLNTEFVSSGAKTISRRRLGVIYGQGCKK